MTRSVSVLLYAVFESASPPPLPPSAPPHAVAQPDGTENKPKTDPRSIEDTANASPERLEAAVQFAAGEVAFEAENYSTAAEAFARAQALSPHADTLYNLGLALAQDGQVMAAWDVFERLRQEKASEVTRRDARVQIERLRRQISFVSVAPPPGTPVCLDGVQIREDEMRPTMPGRHQLTTPRFAKTIVLEPGRTYEIDLRYFSPDPSPAPPLIAPWVAVAVGASAAAVGLSIGASQAQSDTSGQGLALGAASVASLALASGIVALVVHQRKPKASRSPAPSISPC